MLALNWAHSELHAYLFIDLHLALFWEGVWGRWYNRKAPDSISYSWRADSVGTEVSESHKATPGANIAVQRVPQGSQLRGHCPGTPPNSPIYLGSSSFSLLSPRTGAWFSFSLLVSKELHVVCKLQFADNSPRLSATQGQEQDHLFLFNTDPSTLASAQLFIEWMNGWLSNQENKNEAGEATACCTDTFPFDFQYCCHFVYTINKRGKLLYWINS